MSNRIRRSGDVGAHKHAARTRPRALGGRQLTESTDQTKTKAKTKKSYQQQTIIEKPKRVIESSITVAEKTVVTEIDPKQLEVALKLAIQDMQRYDPSFKLSPEQFGDKLTELLAFTPEDQQDFIDKFLKPAIEQYNYYNDPEGWGPWLKTGMELIDFVTGRSLTERVATYYKEGSETISTMGMISSWLADIAIYEAKEQIYNIGAGILGVAQEISTVGSAMHDAIGTAVETVYELTLENPQAVAEEDKQAGATVVSLLSQESVKTGAETALDTYFSFTADVSQYNPISKFLKKYNGNVASAISALLKEGNMTALKVLLTIVFMEEFGVQSIPQTGGLQPLASAPNIVNPYFGRTAMVCVLVNLVVSSIMKIITGGNLSAKHMIMNFLIKGPLSVKVMGVQGAVDKLLKGVLKVVNPYASFAFKKLLTMVIDKVLGSVKTRVKQVVKGTLSTTEKALTQGADLIDILGGLGEEQEVQKISQEKVNKQRSQKTKKA